MADIQQELTRLEEDIRQLKIEFDQYFNGILDIPPDDHRQEIEQSLRRLHGERVTTFADRYRLSSLEARFTSLNGLWNRRLRGEESGARKPPSGAAARKGPDPYDGVVLGKRTSPDQARALYEVLYGGDGRSKKTDFDSFRSFLKTKTEQIRTKTGCTEVRFRIASRGGKLTLKAKPVEE